jgi:prophage DNA circulation protein
MALFDGNLLPASFRGAPFAVIDDAIAGGRRIALHEYPGRDEPWAEDMGRAARRFRFRGFIVDGDIVFAGGPIQLQRALLIAALEKAGPGTLTHPTLGILNVAVNSFSIGQDLGAGRASSVEIDFVESGKQVFPTLLTNSSGILSAANLAKLAIAADFVRAVVLAAATGGSHDDVATVSRLWSVNVGVLASDATALSRLTSQLPGSFGRYSAGGNSGYASDGAAIYAIGTPISTLVADASTNRALIATADSDLADTIAEVTVSTTDGDVAAAVAALVDALGAACADPADAVRLLVDLQGFSPPGPIAAGAMGGSVSDVFRRSAAIALVAAAGRYQPTSYDDAAAKLSMIAEMLDAEMLIAGDAGADDTFKALRDLRTAIINDLRERGASLAPIQTVTVGRPLPALALAQRLYRDPDRADELIRQANPVSPLFMPTTFKALAA